jgi:hypothetical protein
MDYKSNDYVSQLHGDSVKNASLKWLKSYDFQSLNVSKMAVYEAIQDIVNNHVRPVLLNSLNNVWCVSFLFKDELATVNIVKTVARNKNWKRIVCC